MIIVIEGIIGAGKSVLIEKCLEPHLSQKGYRVTIVREPVHKWKESGRLAQFYKDPSRRGYQFQTRAFHDRVREAQEKFKLRDHTDIFIMERSIFTDLIFMKTLREMGTIDNTEYEDYLDLWTMWEEVMPLKPDLFVYLKPNVETCMGRLRERNRYGEEGVSIGYQKILSRKHDDFLKSNIQIDNKKVPVLTLKTEENFRDDKEVQKKIIEEIERYL